MYHRMTARLLTSEGLFFIFFTLFFYVLKLDFDIFKVESEVSKLNLSCDGEHRDKKLEVQHQLGEQAPPSCHGR